MSAIAARLWMHIHDWDDDGKGDSRCVLRVERGVWRVSVH